MFIGHNIKKRKSTAFWKGTSARLKAAQPSPSTASIQLGGGTGILEKITDWLLN